MNDKLFGIDLSREQKSDVSKTIQSEKSVPEQVEEKDYTVKKEHSGKSIVVSEDETFRQESQFEDFVDEPAPIKEKDNPDKSISSDHEFGI